MPWNFAGISRYPAEFLYEFNVPPNSVSDPDSAKTWIRIWIQQNGWFRIGPEQIVLPEPCKPSRPAFLNTNRRSITDVSAVSAVAVVHPFVPMLLPLVIFLLLILSLLLLALSLMLSTTLLLLPFVFSMVDALLLLVFLLLLAILLCCFPSCCCWYS